MEGARPDALHPRADRDRAQGQAGDAQLGRGAEGVEDAVQGAKVGWSIRVSGRQQSISRKQMMRVAETNTFFLVKQLCKSAQGLIISGPNFLSKLLKIFKTKLSVSVTYS